MRCKRWTGNPWSQQSDKGRAGRIRKPGRVVGTMVPGGVKGENLLDRQRWSYRPGSSRWSSGVDATWLSLGTQSPVKGQSSTGGAE